MLEQLLLRRTKADLQKKGELESLPQKTTILVEIHFNDDEKDIYNTMVSESQRLNAELVGSINKQNHLLDVIRQRRQFCNHPALIKVCVHFGRNCGSKLLFIT